VRNRTSFFHPRSIDIHASAGIKGILRMKMLRLKIAGLFELEGKSPLVQAPGVTAIIPLVLRFPSVATAESAHRLTR
jgi:hypothetical protein